MKTQIEIQNATVVVDEINKIVVVKFNKKSELKANRLAILKYSLLVAKEGYVLYDRVQLTEKQIATHARRFDADRAADARAEELINSMSDGDFLQYREDRKQDSIRRQTPSSLRK